MYVVCIKNILSENLRLHIYQHIVSMAKIMLVSLNSTSYSHLNFSRGRLLSCHVC